MSKFVVDGGKKLYGSVEIKSAKNAMLPLLAACVMLGTEAEFSACPKLGDVLVMLEIIESLGGKYSFSGDNLKVDCSSLYSYELPEKAAKKIRASIFLTGPLIARFHRAFSFRPGGCSIGNRPIDMHTDCLKQMNVRVSYDGDFTYLRCDRLVGADIKLRVKSVGVTENVMMAATLAEGETVIYNAAREPEIVCLADFLNACGAKISGAGTSRVVISGVKELTKKKIFFKPVGDRIEAGTFILACLGSGGEIEINNADFSHNALLLKKVYDNACKIALYDDKIYIKASGAGKSAGYVKTAPYPGFPTDLQTPFIAYATTLKGVTRVRECVFDGRFRQLAELKKAGADITVENDLATVRGVNSLHGAEVAALDLRGGAASVIAALKAEGRTVIDCAEVIDRGYERFEKKLAALGADIARI